MKKQILSVAVLAALGAVASTGVQAAPLASGDVLTITTGSPYPGNYTSAGSYFGMDTNAPFGVIGPAERNSIAQGTQGIVIGSAQATGTSHGGAPTGTEGGTIDAAWNFANNTGLHFTSVAITGGSTSGLSFSGWRVTWNGIPTINMGGGSQNCGTTNDGICVTSALVDIGGTFNNGTGLATFTWNGVYGSGYTLDYAAVVPQADPSGFGGTGYSLHLVGVVNQATVIPVPAAVWLLASALGCLGTARYRTAARLPSGRSGFFSLAKWNTKEKLQ